MKTDKKYFENTNTSIKFPELEEKILEYWKKKKIFEKSIESRKLTNKWTFLDGPPFVTGLPHYGTLLSSIPKDLFGRYWTMKGYRVRRVWGWDGHGLPIENKVENKLGIKSKKEIEDKIGVKKFIDECKTYVNETSSEWEWYVDHIGRWVDFRNAYKTWDKDYMESVMWVFKSMYEKDFIYKGLRVSLYCPHCETPISNFEVAMDSENYKDVTEPATTYKYPVDGEKDTYFLAWSTTPWNKIVTPALAINPKLTYVKVLQGNEKYILEKGTLKMLTEKPEYKIIDEFRGDKLIGKKYIPHYDYYKDEVKPGEKIFELVPANFVSSEEGTGVVTLAVYGEEDLEIMKNENVHMEMHVHDNGYIKENVPKFGGMYYMNANEAVDSDLESRGLIYKKEPVTHKIPHCWRCKTRLFHNPQNAWYVDIQRLKAEMKKTNKAINWVPKHFKYGRFLKSMESAPDWCISRSRYWGSPVPVWECECGNRFIPGSISDLEKASGQKIKDLHKPEIDNVLIRCDKCGKIAKRVPEVLDSWIEAGSAPFAERNFPFNKDEKLSEFFPADFIAEYTGQIRAWFYVLHVIATSLYKSNAFKNVVVTGVILGTDGQKMSKNYGNFPDPKLMLKTYGGDALRLYLMGSPVMKGEDIRISEEEYRTQVKSFLLLFWNVYNFFVTYAISDGWKPNNKYFKAVNILDRWIISRLKEFIYEATDKGYEKFDTQEVVGQAYKFLSDLSRWYVRRIRNRVGPNRENGVDKSDAHMTLYTVLKEFSKMIAPLIPFTTEEIYRNLTKEESVHLSELPVVNKDIDSDLLKKMIVVREIVEKAHSERKSKNIAVRQPLSRIEVSGCVIENEDLINLIKDEINVKEVVFKNIKGDISIVLDTAITPELEEEAKTRELIRNIQKERKTMGISLSQYINVSNDWFPKSKDNMRIIKDTALVRNINIGEFKVSKS